jgi:hypothetical protein
MQLRDLTPNDKNPRTITPEKLEFLTRSMKEFGDLSGIVFNRKTGTLVGGHQRIKSLKDGVVEMLQTYKKPTPTGTVAEGFIKIDGERYSYREVSWDETKEKAANIAANKGAGTWDLPKLSEMLKDIDTFGFDLDLTMFSEFERADLFPDLVDVQGHQRAKTGSKDVKTNAKEKPKGFYKLGKHRLLCGDFSVEELTEKLRTSKDPITVVTNTVTGNALIKSWEAEGEKVTSLHHVKTRKAPLKNSGKAVIRVKNKKS